MANNIPRPLSITVPPADLLEEAVESELSVFVDFFSCLNDAVNTVSKVRLKRDWNLLEEQSIRVKVDLFEVLSELLQYLLWSNLFHQPIKLSPDTVELIDDRVVDVMSLEKLGSCVSTFAVVVHHRLEALLQIELSDVELFLVPVDI